MTATDLAAAAAAEVASREKHYPAMVAAGEIGEGEAAADLEAWRAIAALLPLCTGADGEGWTRNPLLQLDTDLPWAALEAAARNAVERLAARPGAEARREAAAAIAAQLADERWFWSGARGPRPSAAAMVAA